MEESNSKMQELQFLEQNLQNLMLQKQSFQMELSETTSAIKEIENAGEEVYKIIGQLMIKSDKKRMQEELADKEKLLKLRSETLEKQEFALNEKLSSIREEVMSGLKKE